MIEKKSTQTISFITLFVTAVLTCISVALGDNFSFETKTVFFIALPVALIFCICINLSKKATKPSSERFSCLFLLAEGLCMTIASGSFVAFLCMSLFTTVVVFLMNTRMLFFEHACATSIILIFLNCVPNHFLQKNLTTLELIAAIIGITAMDALLNVVKRSIARIYSSLQEQRRSSDEILKIIEAKADEAKKATKSKSDFLASMSHEIRTPINSIIGMDEMILRETKEGFTRDYATDIQVSSNMLLSLVNNILDFSKIESGKMQIIEVDYDLSSMINDLVIMHGGRAQSKQLSFMTEIDSTVPRLLHGDEIRIKQIVSNIMSNAIKYTDNGYVKLKLGYEKKDEHTVNLMFSVEDTGHGMKKEDMEKLFKPFERIDEVKNRHVEGTGLGMSITLQLLALMDSKMDVESEYGKGSTFSFKLRQKVTAWEELGDFEETLKKSRPSESTYHESFTAPEGHILVVDDIKMNLNVFSNLLKRTKVQIDTALSGKEALELARTTQYHVIFMDHMMPEMDGIETLERMRKDRFSLNRTTPAVALTANAVSGARESYIEKGFVDYLSKPVDAKRLEVMVQNYLPADLVKPYTEEQLTIEEESNLDNIEKLRKIKYLNVDSGFVYTGDAENYEMVMEDFYNATPQKLELIRNLCDSDDIKNYTIEVHALKSSARMIGDDELSEMAKTLEMAGKANDVATVKRDTDALLERYKILYDCLRKIYARNNLDDFPPIDKDGMKVIADKMRKGLAMFDFDVVEEQTKEMDKYRLPEEYRQKFSELKGLVANVSLDGIKKWLDDNFPET